jgi:hypothetical protein
MGSYEESLRSVSLAADASLAVYTGPPGGLGSASPNAGMLYRVVRITGKDTVGLATAATQPTVGVLQNKPQVVGQAATVAIRGISQCIAGTNNIAAGAELTVDSTGRVIAAATTNLVIGIALQPSSVVGEQIAVLLRPGYKV